MADNHPNKRQREANITSEATGHVCEQRHIARASRAKSQPVRVYMSDCMYNHNNHGNNDDDNNNTTNTNTGEDKEDTPTVKME